MHSLDYVYFIHKANLLKKKPLKSHCAAIHSVLRPPKYLCLFQNTCSPIRSNTRSPQTYLVENVFFF